MNITYSSEPFFSTEVAMIIARAMASPDVFDERDNINNINAFLKNIEKEHPAQAQLAQQRLEPLCEISDYIMANLKVSPEKLKFYFKAAQGGSFVPGRELAVMQRQKIDAALLPADKREKIISSFFQVCFEPGDNTEAVDSFAQLAAWLETRDIVPSDKWNCMLLCQQIEHYQAEIKEILLQAEQLYREKEYLWRPVLEACINDFKAKSEADSDYMGKTFHVNVECDNLIIHPSLSCFNMLSLTSFTVEDFWQSDADIVDIGYLIDELIAFDKQSEFESERLSSQLKALSDARRLQILTALRKGPLCGQEIAELVGLTPATVSHHMNELICTDFVNIVKDKTRVNYSYSHQGIKNLIDNIRHQFSEENI